MGLNRTAGSSAPHRGRRARVPSRLLPLMLLTLMWVISGCVVTPIGAQEPGEAAGAANATIAVAPVEGGPGTPVFVSGAGWDGGEVVYVNLEIVPDGEAVETTVAIATADDEGRFTATFAYPTDPIWAEPGPLEIVAYSLETGVRATAPFTVVEAAVPLPDAATPSATVPAPTATPLPTQGAVAKPPVIATATPTRGPVTNIGVVVSSALNVRSGPSTAFPVRGSLCGCATGWRGGWHAPIPTSAAWLRWCPPRSRRAQR